MCSHLEQAERRFIVNGSKRARSAHGPSSDWLVVKSVEVSIVSLLVPKGLGSTSCWAAQCYLSRQIGVSVSAQQLRESVVCILEGES